MSDNLGKTDQYKLYEILRQQELSKGRGTNAAESTAAALVAAVVRRLLTVQSVISRALYEAQRDH